MKSYVLLFFADSEKTSSKNLKMFEKCDVFIGFFFLKNWSISANFKAIFTYNLLNIFTILQLQFTL